MISKAKHMAVLYRHIRLDSNQPFYIGIGRDEKRAYELIGRNKHWHSIVNKHGYKVHIMLDDLSWEEAQQKEIEFIQLYGRKDLGKGGLVNMTDGGDGTLGHICSEEAKAKISTTLKGKKRSEEFKAKMRKPKSEEHKAKTSAAKRGKPNPKIAVALKGRVISEEWKAKISTTLKGRKESEEAKANRIAAIKAYWAKKRWK